MMHTLAGFMIAAAASAASFWGVLTHPVMPHATSTWPVATTMRPGFATSSMPMHPPFMYGTTTPPGDDGEWRNASSSLEHMPRPIPPFMEHRHASTTASTTWKYASTTRPHMMASTTDDEDASSAPHMMPPKHTEDNGNATSSAARDNRGFWQHLFRFF